MLRLPPDLQAKFDALKLKDREYWDDELYSPEALANWDYRAAIEQLILGEKPLNKQPKLEPEEIELAQNALAFLLSKDSFKDEDVATAILGGSCDAEQAANVIGLAYDLDWDGEPLQALASMALNAPALALPQSEEIPFLEEAQTIPTVGESNAKRITVEEAPNQQQLQLPTVVEPEEELVHTTTVVRGEDGIYRDIDTGEVMMTEEEALALLRVSKPKFEIVDLETADQYIGWMCELQEKATRTVGQMLAIVGDILTAMNSISYYYAPSLKAVIDPQLKRKKNKTTGEITISPKNYKGPQGSVFFKTTGGAEIYDERQVREFINELPKDMLEFYGVSVETTRKYSKTRLKELVAAGTEIPGTRVTNVQELGIMTIGPAGPRTGWTPTKLKTMFKPFNKRMTNLKYVAYGKPFVVKEERQIEESDDDDDFAD